MDICHGEKERERERHVFVTSNLDYCNALRIGLPQ